MTPAAFATTSIDAAQSKGQRRAAIVVCGLGLAMGLCLLPIAARQGPAFPGFLLINQTALIAAYALSAWVLFAQFRRDRSLPLLLVAGGTLYTAAIVTLQLLTMPGVAGGAGVIGAGPATTTWLWTFWHLGPPSCALAYAIARCGDLPALVARGQARAVALAVALTSLVLAGATALLATLALPWLPHQVTGDDYSAVTSSGIGPALQVLTLVALAAVVRIGRKRQSVLDLWIAVSLALLVIDNFLTMTGGARGTVGWFGGRIEAFVSAFAILWAYLTEVDALRGRAEAAAAEAAQAGLALRQAQKMEAIGRLTGGVAHDFNNLLTIVTSGFEMIRRRPDDRARVIKMADAGLEATQRGAKLTRQLLTFARKQNLQPETVNLNASLLEFEPLARRALGEAVEMTLTLHPALHPARVDPGEFEAAVLNLVVNARDAMPAVGGRIAVSTRNGVRDADADAEVGANAAGPGSTVVISVADNGSGMNDVIRAQIFEPFFTTKEFGKGSGLGLSQVYGFAQAAGGGVEVMSVSGQGTTVEIWLPRVDAAVTTSASRPPASLCLAEAGETVLAVEDEPAVLSALVENLADLGYRVISARDAAEALERLREQHRIDVLLSDVVMPGGMNGVQLAIAAGRVRPDLRVVLTSGYTGEALAGDHLVPASVPILTKPYRREELAERLKVSRRSED